MVGMEVVAVGHTRVWGQCWDGIRPRRAVGVYAMTMTYINNSNRNFPPRRGGALFLAITATIHSD